VPDDRGRVAASKLSVVAPMQGTVVSVAVAEGDVVHEGRAVVVLESMKMEHDVVAPANGIVLKVLVASGETVNEGQRLATIERAQVAARTDDATSQADPQAVRDDLAEVVERHALTLDVARPDAVAKRRSTGQRTVRENIDDLCDPDSFVEYAPLTIAASGAAVPSTISSLGPRRTDWSAAWVASTGSCSATMPLVAS
jgi:pyruvate/2-oxoglutarate dehydrogenase complex dihydrolipoamide acyltransferase (E2) component